MKKTLSRALAVVIIVASAFLAVGAYALDDPKEPDIIFIPDTGKELVLRPIAFSVQDGVASAKPWFITGGSVEMDR